MADAPLTPSGASSKAPSEANGSTSRPPSSLSWLSKRWWNLERDFLAAPQSEQKFVDLIDEARKAHTTLHRHHPDKRRGIREEVRRDVIPFYLLGTKCRESFIDVRAAMWLTHVETFSKIKNRAEPTKTGSTEIDYVGGHLDIIDRKFGVLLSVQSLIGVVISVTLSTFKDSVLGLLKAPIDRVSYVVCLSFVAFLFSAWYGMALHKMKWITLGGIALAGFLLLVQSHLPDYLAAGLIVSLFWLWFTTTLVCLRGAGRARWGEMRSVDTASTEASLVGPLKVERDYQLMSLIRALVGRTAIYRAGVLLVYTTLYCLVLTGGVTALVLTKQENAGAAKQANGAKAVKTLPDVTYTIHFGPGDSCESSSAMGEIESIVEEVENRRPRGVLVIGSTDAMPMGRALAKAVGDDTKLARTRAECVSTRMAQLLHVRGESIPVEATTKGPQDKSARARAFGNPADRVTEVRLIQPTALSSK